MQDLRRGRKEVEPRRFPLEALSVDGDSVGAWPQLAVGAAVDPYGRGGVLRDGDIKMDLASVFFPACLDEASDGVVGGIGPLQTLDEMRGDDDVAETWGKIVFSDADDVVHKPCGDVSEEDVVERRVVEPL